MKVRALIIHPDQQPQVTQINTDLPSLQAAIGGGLLEHLYIHNGAHAYVDEEGKPNRLCPNRTASLMIAHYRRGFLRYDYIAGPALFLGTSITSPWLEADVPDGLIDLCFSLIPHAEGK